MADWIHYLLVVRKHIVDKINYRLDRIQNTEGKQREIEFNVFHRYEWLASEFNRNIDFYLKMLTRRLESEKLQLREYEEEAVRDYGEHISREQFKPRELNKIERESEIRWR